MVSLGPLQTHVNGGGFPRWDKRPRIRDYGEIFVLEDMGYGSISAGSTCPRPATHMLRPFRLLKQIFEKNWLGIQLCCDPTSSGYKRDSIMMVHKFKPNLFGTQ